MCFAVAQQTEALTLEDDHFVCHLGHMVHALSEYVQVFDLCTKGCSPYIATFWNLCGF